MPPKSKKNAPPSTPRRGTHKSRSKPHPPPEFQSNIELVSMDDSSTMMELRQRLGILTTALVMMASRMDQFDQGKASSVDSTSAQPAAAVLSAQPMTSWGQLHGCRLADGTGVSPAWDQGWGHSHHLRCFRHGTKHPKHGRAPSEHGTPPSIGHHQ